MLLISLLLLLAFCKADYLELHVAIAVIANMNQRDIIMDNVVSSINSCMDPNGYICIGDNTKDPTTYSPFETYVVVGGTNYEDMQQCINDGIASEISDLSPLYVVQVTPVTDPSGACFSISNIVPNNYLCNDDLCARNGQEATPATVRFGKYIHSPTLSTTTSVATTTRGISLGHPNIVQKARRSNSEPEAAVDVSSSSGKTCVKESLFFFSILIILGYILW